MPSQLVELAEFDLVLLDWHLADCDGEESIRRLRDAGCMARIVVLSGETNATLIRNSVDLGAAGFIPKKYSSEMMVAALRHVLAGRIFLPLETLNAAPPDVEARQGQPTIPGSRGSPRARWTSTARPRAACPTSSSRASSTSPSRP